MAKNLDVNATIELEIDRYTDAYLENLGFHKNGTVTVNSIWKINNNTGLFFLDPQQLESEIKKCKNWIKRYQELEKNFEKQNVLQGMKNSFRLSGKDYQNKYSQELDAGTQRKNIQKLGRLLQEGYALLQHLRLTVIPDTQEVKYHLLLDEESFKEISVNIREVLAGINLDLEKNIEGIQSLRELYENSSLRLYERRFTEKYGDDENKTVNYNNISAPQLKERYDLIDRFYRDILVKGKSTSKSWNKGRTYEVLKQSVYESGEWNKFFNSLKIIYDEENFSTYQHSAIYRYSRRFERGKRKGRVTKTNITGISSLKRIKASQEALKAFESLQESLESTTGGYFSDNIASWRHKTGDVKISKNMGIELKNLASSGSANLITATTVIDNIIKITEKLKGLKKQKGKFTTNKKKEKKQFLTQNEVINIAKKALGGDII